MLRFAERLQRVPFCNTSVMTDSVRLAKRVAAQANCSRREAELLIENGAVRVDGVVVETPQERVGPAQRVEIDPASRSGAAQLPADVTLLVHKPAGIAWDAPIDRLISRARRSTDADAGRPTSNRHFKDQRCITPLEPGASGLVVFTQEAGIARKLLEDARLTENELMVEVAGAVSAGQLRRLNESAVIDGRAMLPAKVSIGRQSPEQTGLRFAIKGVWPGQAAQLCDAANLRIVSMKRIRIGRVPLAGLKVGEWRFLAPHERF